LLGDAETELRANLLAGASGRRGRRVGLAVPDIADPFFAAMTGSIEVDLVGRGMRS